MNGLQIILPAMCHLKCIESSSADCQCEFDRIGNCSPNDTRREKRQINIYLLRLTILSVDRKHLKTNGIIDTYRDSQLFSFTLYRPEPNNKVVLQSMFTRVFLRLNWIHLHLHKYPDPALINHLLISRSEISPCLRSIGATCSIAAIYPLTHLFLGHHLQVVVIIIKFYTILWESERVINSIVCVD